MAVFTSTELNATIDEIWDAAVDDARYGKAVIMPRVLNKSALVKNHGDKVNLTYGATYTAGDVTAATGAFTPQTITPSSVTVTVNQWKQVAIETVDKDKIQSLWKPESDFPKDAGKALAVLYDTALGALYSSFTTNVVGEEGNPGIFDETAMLNAMLLLADLSIANDDSLKSDLSFILPPVAIYKGICTKPEFVDSDKTGLPASVLTTGFKAKLYGVPFYESTLVATVGIARKALLLHKSAAAIAFQRNNNMGRAPGVAAGKLSYITVCDSLYGYSAFRENHAVVINVRSS